MIAPQLTRPLAQRVDELPPAVFTTAFGVAPESVLERAEAALDAGKTHYTDRPGILPLRQNVSAVLTASGFTIAPDAITITCGLIESRYVALNQLVSSGAGVITSGELEEAVAGVCALLGLKHIVSRSPFTELADAGIILTRGTAELASALALGGSPWIVHEWQPDDQISPMQADAAARVIVIGEFQQMPGWRVGWMAGSKAAGKLRAYKQSMTICTPSISQWAALGIKPQTGANAE